MGSTELNDTDEEIVEIYLEDEMEGIREAVFVVSPAFFSPVEDTSYLSYPRHPVRSFDRLSGTHEESQLAFLGATVATGSFLGGNDRLHRDKD